VAAAAEDRLAAAKAEAATGLQSTAMAEEAAHRSRAATMTAQQATVEAGAARDTAER
jgi:hypothetical protein